MENEQTQRASNLPARLVDAVGKPFIQAEELTERLASVIEAATADHAIGFAAVFGALEQLKAQYMARVALKVSAELPGDVLAKYDAVDHLRAVRLAQAAAIEDGKQVPRGSIEKRLAAQKQPTKAPRPAAEKARAPAKGALRSVK